MYLSLNTLKQDAGIIVVYVEGIQLAMMSGRCLLGMHLHSSTNGH
jgi:hypothetical protein